MSAKHTPGPWTVYPHTNGRLGSTVSFDGRDTGLTSTDICEIMPEDDNGSAIRVADANAKLIAAAPDLLQALLKAHTDLLRTDFSTSDERDRYMRKYIRDALAKAGVLS